MRALDYNTRGMLALAFAVVRGVKADEAISFAGLKPSRVRPHELCPSCDGKGEIDLDDGRKPVRCRRCDGKGREIRRRR